MSMLDSFFNKGFRGSKWTTATVLIATLARELEKMKAAKDRPLLAAMQRLMRKLKMRESRVVSYLSSFILLLLLIHGSNGDNPYRFYNWKITYGNIYPMGVKQQGILINGQFPGPGIDCVTNDNLVISVFNYLNEPFLLTWNGLQNRRNSWQDGVSGTSCPIPPGKNFTYVLQAKDQIGSFFYFPSLSLHRAAGGFGGIRILSRPRIPVPFPPPAGDFTILTGDWFKLSHLGQSMSVLVTADQAPQDYYILHRTHQDLVYSLLYDQALIFWSYLCPSCS